jgi:uncharacterized coiled-coil protein SlyX
MRPTLIGLVIGLCGLGLTAPVRGQSPPDREIIELQREIAQAEAMIAKWQADLAALKERLARAEALQAESGSLRFPWDIERAMIGEGIQRSRGRVLEPLRIQGRGSTVPGWEPLRPTVPRR